MTMSKQQTSISYYYDRFFLGLLFLSWPLRSWMNPGPISANSVSRMSSLEHYLFEPRSAPYLASLLRIVFPGFLTIPGFQLDSPNRKFRLHTRRQEGWLHISFPRPHLSFVPFSLYGFTSVQDVPPSRAPVLAGQPLFMALGIILLLPPSAHLQVQ